MKTQNKKAFTMIELIFVIVVIGILSAIAVPKFAATRGDAVMTKAKTTVASVRSAIATQRQKRILRGEFATIIKLTNSTTPENPVFDFFDGNLTGTAVLEYPPLSCATSTTSSCWRETTLGAGTTASPTKYTFNLPTTGGVVFLLQDNRFVCEAPNDPYCRKLTQ